MTYMHDVVSLDQTLYKAAHDPIVVEHIHEDSLSLVLLRRLLDSAQGSRESQDCCAPHGTTIVLDGTVGVAATYRSDCSLSCLAFATLTRALVVRFSAPEKPNQGKKNVSRGRAILRDHILCNPDIQLYGYRMDRIAVSLFLELELRINAAVDILSAFPQDDRRSLQAIMNALGGELLLQKESVNTLFTPGEGNDIHTTKNVALQAWAVCHAAELTHMATRYASISRIDTDTIPGVYLGILAKIARDAEILDSLKPTEVVNEVKEYSLEGKDNVNLECTRFKTRIMPSRNQFLRIETQDEKSERRSMFTGQARRVDGRQAHIAVRGSVHPSGKVLSVTTVGKGALTAAEALREDVVLKALQGGVNLMEHPFFCSIWAPSSSKSWRPEVRNVSTKPLGYCESSNLNSSQDNAVQRIVSEADRDRLVLIQGPPGTGKTTVIAASVISIIKNGSERTVWLVAHSNIAVKNMAEKLVKVDFSDFRILVSKDFHFDWHEHLYTQLEHNLIRSDTFDEDIVAASQRALGARVMLCTLSMLSNPHIHAFTRIIPVHTIMFDEASQIEVGNYLPVLHRFKTSLQKMVFIGDDKQLAPFGQDDVQQLQSVFEFPHLRRRAQFLDTQYRMPVVIGEFISRHVYGNQLNTKHDIDSRTACRFLHVERSQEQKSGNSWMNQQEIAAIAKLTGLYLKQGKKYKIITPYDAQRTAIEKTLKSAELPWENKCFNVDSFQGNEEDHIIISLVRSERVGFLKNVRRTNVMLTRCKKSMVICTSRDFLTFGRATSTLVGKLAAAMGPEGWLYSCDIDRDDFGL